MSSVAVVASSLAATAASAYQSTGFGTNPNGAHGAYGYMCDAVLTGDAVNFLSVDMNTGNAQTVFYTDTGTYSNYGTPIYYWADWNSAYGYTFHGGSTGPSLGGSFFTSIKYSSGPYWSVQVGNLTGTSWQNTSLDTALITGLAGSSSGDQESGSSSGLGWYDTANSPHGTWRNPTQQVDYPPAAGYWVSSGNYWRDAVNAGWGC